MRPSLRTMPGAIDAPCHDSVTLAVGKHGAGGARTIHCAGAIDYGFRTIAPRAA